jgi:hypothetical protein
MTSRFFRIRPTLALVCVLALLWPSLMSAITNDGYQGNTIGGRPSIAIVDAPGGTRVNTLLGNLFLSRADLRIPGRGLPIELQFACDMALRIGDREENSLAKLASRRQMSLIPRNLRAGPDSHGCRKPAAQP